ncbi:MAG: putative ABC transporter permease [Johnsonella sp.]|nr:putative ABC transporter permease [Johnsonella sp.]
MFEYSYREWLIFFYIYSFLGWCFESAYVSLTEKKPVNRGFLRSPLLPLYGNGACIMLFIAMPSRSSHLLTYLIGALGATLLELITGIGMEGIFKVKYWDYSNKKYNYKGVICLSSSLFWGALTLILIDVMQPRVETLLRYADPALLDRVLKVLNITFALDCILSTKAALDFAKALSALDRVKSELSQLQLRLSLLRETVRDSAANTLLSAGEHIGQMADNVLSLRPPAEHLFAVKERAFNMIAAIKAEIETRLSQNGFEPKISMEYKKILEVLNSLKKSLPSSNRVLTFFRRGMLKGNPDATSPYPEAFDEFKENEIQAKKLQREKRRQKKRKK